jgi:hypothetical protein
MAAVLLRVHTRCPLVVVRELPSVIFLFSISLGCPNPLVPSVLFIPFSMLIELNMCTVILIAAIIVSVCGVDCVEVHPRAKGGGGDVGAW